MRENLNKGGRQEVWGYLSVEDNGPRAVFSATAEQERVVWTPGQVGNAVGLASHLVLDLGTLSL